MIHPLLHLLPLKIIQEFSFFPCLFFIAVCYLSTFIYMHNQRNHFLFINSIFLVRASFQYSHLCMYLIFHFRGYQLHNPFYSIWATKLGSDLAVSFHIMTTIAQSRQNVVETRARIVSESKYGPNTREYSRQTVLSVTVSLGNKPSDLCRKLRAQTMFHCIFDYVTVELSET